MLASARRSMTSIDPYRTAKYPYCLTKGNTGIFYAIVSADVRPDSNTSDTSDNGIALGSPGFVFKIVSLIVAI